MRYFAFVAVWLAACCASAQITVPEVTEPHKPIVATLKAPLPEGAQLRGSWNVTGGELVQVDPNTIHIWAGPGNHVVTASGVWVVTQTVTLPDGKTFQALVDFGQYAYTAAFKVGGTVPPVPPPPPPGNRWALILEETDNRTPQNAALFLAVRKAYPNKQRFLILDKDNPRADWAPYFAPAQGLPLPALLVFADDGTLVSKGPCPKTLDEIKAKVAL